MRVLMWHVHGTWTDSFVRGPHQYLLPTNRHRDADGRGRRPPWDWPDTTEEVLVEDLEDAEFDVVLLQRPHEAALVEQWTGRRPGRDLPALYVEHNTPGGNVPYTPHPLAGQDAIELIHVTHFNDLMWNSDGARVSVIIDGVADPGHLYTGENERLSVVVNDPIRRGRAVGTDLLPRFLEAAPIDVFGMGADGLADRLGVSHERLSTADVPQRRMHELIATSRAYVHPFRWTSLGLSLMEAMFIGLPIVCLNTTEAAELLTRDAVFLSTSPAELVESARRLIDDPVLAHEYGRRARELAIREFSLDRFLSEWDRALDRCLAGG